MSGFVEIDDSGFSPEGFFGEPELIDFSFDFGGIVLDKAGARAFSFGGPWEVVPGAGLVWYLDASAAEGRSELGPTISVSGGTRDGFGMASFLGTCETGSEFSCQITFRTAAQFEMRTATAPVPLPAAGWLMTAALVGLGAAGRRRARGRNFPGEKRRSRKRPGDTDRQSVAPLAAVGERLRRWRGDQGSRPPIEKRRRMSDLLKLLAASLMLAGISGRSAFAETLLYAVDGRCVEDCGNVGLGDGDGFTGSISVDGAFFAPGSVVGNAALRGYSFLFGDFGLTYAELSDPEVFIAWGSAPEVIDGLFFQGFVSNDPASPGPTLNLDTLLGGISFASNDGHGFEVPDGSVFSLGTPAYLNVDRIELSTVAPVPLPAAGWLLVASLLGLGAARRLGREKPAFRGPTQAAV